MKTIYLVRHGEAEVNLEPATYQGGESPLTACGKEQARFIAERASRLPIDVIIASTMRRTQETATLISQSTNKPFESMNAFEERRLPTSVIGKTRTDAAALDLMERWVLSAVQGGPRVEDGENFDDLSDRAAQALEILEKRTEENILVVGHGFFTRMLIARAWFGDALTPEKFAPLEWGMRTTNTGLSTMKIRPFR